MTRTITCLAAVTVLTGIASGADTATTTDERVAELTDLVSQMRDEIRELRSGQDPDWLTEQRSEEIRGLVHDVLADADTRASLLQSGMTAGYDGGFMVGSPDGNFALKLNGQVQFRYVYNNRDAADTSVSGFENRRTQLKLKGHVVDPSWTYFVQWAASNNGGAVSLDDAWIEKDLGRGWSLRAGQYKIEFLREEMMSSSRQLAVERSLVNEEFNQDRSQGLQLHWAGDDLRFWVAYHNGFGQRNTRAVDDDNREFALTGRVEWLAAGSWKQFKSFSAKRGSEHGLLIGAAANFEKEEYGQRFAAGPPTSGDNDEQERFIWTVDASAHFDGWNLYAAFIGNHLEGAAGNTAAPGAADVDQYGLVVQGGVYVGEKTELFARYEWGDEDTTAANVDDLSVLTVGLINYYNKNVKSTIDFGYAFDDISGTWASASSGWRADGAATDDGQFVVRGQLQLTF